jgi:hypothetical protein
MAYIVGGPRFGPFLKELAGLLFLFAYVHSSVSAIDSGSGGCTNGVPFVAGYLEQDQVL